MRPLYMALPHADTLLSLDPEQLAGLTVFAFRSLTSHSESAVRRCVQHWAAPYPPDLRPEIIERLMSAWRRLKTEGLLDAQCACACETAHV